MAERKIDRLIVVCRHGHRGPVVDPIKGIYIYIYIDIYILFYIEWKGKFGELTQRGAEHMSAEGAKFRNAYKGFFTNSLKKNKSDFKVISANLNRTLESAFYFLSALNKRGSEYSVNENMEEKWEYLKDHNLLGYKMDENIIFGSYGSLSPKAMELTKSKMHKMREEKCGYDKFGENIKYIAESCEVEVENIDYEFLFYLMDSLFTLKEHGIPLPSECSEELYSNLESLPLLIFYDLWMNNLHIRKLSNYVVFKQIIQILQRKEEEPRFIYYSSHDASLVAMLITFRFLSRVNPYFGAKIIFEVSQQIVRVLYSEKGDQNIIFHGEPEALIRLLRGEMFESDKEFLDAVGNSNLSAKENELHFDLFKYHGI